MPGDTVTTAKDWEQTANRSSSQQATTGVSDSSRRKKKQTFQSRASPIPVVFNLFTKVFISKICFSNGVEIIPCLNLHAKLCQI